MPDKESNAIVVKRQNFDNAMRSIRDFSEQAKEYRPLDRVSNSGGFLGLGDHKVTGNELNTAVSQIENQLIELKGYNQKFLDLITDIYKAFDALDREHIAGILIAANAAKSASDKATQNVEAIQKIVVLLQKFNKKLEKLEHLMDVDKAWELLEEQNQLLNALYEYKNELTKLKHLKDVDKLWIEQDSQREYIESLVKRIGKIDAVLDMQAESIVDLTNTINCINESQQSFINAANTNLAERQAAIDRHFDSLENDMQEKFVSLSETLIRNQNSINSKVDELYKMQTDKLESMEESQTNRLSKMEQDQTEWFNTIQKSQSKALCQISESQSATLKKIQETQADSLVQMSQEQAATLAQISQEQFEKLEIINKSLEQEKSMLTELVANLSQKVKIAFFLAGGAASITIIHLILSVAGVF